MPADTALLPERQGVDTPRPPETPCPPEPVPPATPDREISLEEWVAAGQACCGAGPDS
jgi:hypothetical protein